MKCTNCTNASIACGELSGFGVEHTITHVYPALKYHDMTFQGAPWSKKFQVSIWRPQLPSGYANITLQTQVA
jgi:hypothetical protein